MFEKIFLNATKDELKEALQMATDDIKFNKIHFGKKTSLSEMIWITERCISALKRSC
ncbi:MAG: hypothetical protein AB6733_12340 [Clostridiaceae bacterium]